MLKVAHTGSGGTSWHILAAVAADADASDVCVGMLVQAHAFVL